MLADRFVWSTVAYQGHAGGFPIADIMLVAQARECPERFAVIDASGTIDETSAKMFGVIAQHEALRAGSR